MGSGQLETRQTAHVSRSRLPDRPLRRDRPHREVGMGQVYQATDTELNRQDDTQLNHGGGPLR